MENEYLITLSTQTQDVRTQGPQPIKYVMSTVCWKLVEYYKIQSPQVKNILSATKTVSLWSNVKPLKLLQ